MRAGEQTFEAAAAQYGETFFLVSARARRLVVLDKAEGTGFLRAAPRVGSSVPAHATAVGKLYLALPRMSSQIERGAALARQALSLDSKCVEALNVLALVAMRKRDLTEARRLFLRALHALSEQVGPPAAGALPVVLPHQPIWSS